MNQNRFVSHLILVVAVLLCGTLAGAGSARAAGYCTQTADLLLDACKASVVDDGAVGKAICINIGETADRQACFDDLAGSQDEAAQLCLAQHDSRLAACGLLGEDRYDPEISPNLFDSPAHPSKPNPYFPLRVGNHWEYRSATQVNTVDVVNETKLIDDVRCAVFRDLVYEGGFLLEGTDDWYVPAKDGSVWYFGEKTGEYETFKGDRPVLPELVNIDGSFKQDREGDKGGIIMLASPHVGDVYLEEFSLGNAEDVTEILSTTYSYGHDLVLDEGVPAALAQRFCKGDCIVTKNYSLLEPGQFARKYYARGIGTILEVENTGEVVQLVGCNFDSRCSGLPKP